MEHRDSDGNEKSCLDFLEAAVFTSGRFASTAVGTNGNVGSGQLVAMLSYSV